MTWHTSGHQNAGLDFRASLKGTGQGNIIGVLEFGTVGQSAGQAGDPYAERCNDAAQVHGGLFTFQVSVGGHDDLGHLAVLQAFRKFTDADIVGADALRGRNGAVEHVIEASEYAGMFDDDHVLRLLDDADLAGLTPGVAADGAWV